MANAPSKTAFWNVNVPSELQSEQCPDFLQYAFDNEKDREILATPDSEYHRHSWEDVQEIIRDNRLDLFERLPSDLRRYREYCAKLEKEHGSVMEFVMQERLKWHDLRPRDEPFVNEDDLKILRNDWPYGLDTRIVHLVVWTKFELATVPISKSDPVGDLTPEIRQEINDFVDRTFVAVCGKQNVLWFKNWSALKSIHSVEHFHVMLFDPSTAFIDRITGNDVAMIDEVRDAP